MTGRDRNWEPRPSAPPFLPECGARTAFSSVGTAFGSEPPFDSSTFEGFFIGSEASGGICHHVTLVSGVGVGNPATTDKDYQAYGEW